MTTLQAAESIASQQAQADALAKAKSAAQSNAAAGAKAVSQTKSADTKAQEPLHMRVMRVRGPGDLRVRRDASLSSVQVGALRSGAAFAFSHVGEGWAKLSPLHYKDLQESATTCDTSDFRPHNPETQGYCVVQWEGRDIFDQPSDAIKATVLSRFVTVLGV